MAVLKKTETHLKNNSKKIIEYLSEMEVKQVCTLPNILDS